MALKDKNVLTASTGFIYTGSVGLAFPTPAAITAFDPSKFGSVQYDIDITAVSGNVKLKVNSVDTADIPYDSEAGAIQTILEAHAGVGEGNVIVEDGATSGEFVVTFTAELQGVDPGLTAGPSGVTVSTKTALNGWTMVGHTSREDLPELGFEGGDSEVKGTWQNAQLKEVQTEAPSDHCILKLVQIDRSTFTLYYGQSSTPSVPGVFGVAGTPSPVEKALLIIIVDGDVNLGFSVPKASFKRDEAAEFATDDFAGFPVRATFLKYGTRDLYRWISEDYFD